MLGHSRVSFVVFFNDTATTEIYTLSLHDALPILGAKDFERGEDRDGEDDTRDSPHPRSEEHTSELQSHSDLVCRLLLEIKQDKRSVHRPLYTPAHTARHHVASSVV